MAEVRRRCDAAGTQLIFDEIPSGLGKTGRFFAFEHFRARPDMVVLGRALGGGMLPGAAVLANARFDIARGWRWAIIPTRKPRSPNEQRRPA